MTHHHSICAGSGALFDVAPMGVEQLRLRSPERHGFDVEAVDVTFRGRRAACRAPA